MSLDVRRGDITAEEVDAVVNAANPALSGGGGVDGAIHHAGGPEIAAACRDLRATRYPRGLPTGEAVATTAGRLSARWVIHTVGPVYRNGEDRSLLLHSCYVNSLALARELGARSVAFPLISAGVYAWPPDDALRIAFAELGGVDDLDVRLILFNKDLMARARRLRPGSH